MFNTKVRANQFLSYFLLILNNLNNLYSDSLFYNISLFLNDWQSKKESTKNCLADLIANAVVVKRIRAFQYPQNIKCQL